MTYVTGDTLHHAVTVNYKTSILNTFSACLVIKSVSNMSEIEQYPTVLLRFK